MHNNSRTLSASFSILGYLLVFAVVMCLLVGALEEAASLHLDVDRESRTPPEAVVATPHEPARALVAVAPLQPMVAMPPEAAPEPVVGVPHEPRPNP